MVELRSYLKVLLKIFNTLQLNRESLRNRTCRYSFATLSNKGEMHRGVFSFSLYPMQRHSLRNTYLLSICNGLKSRLIPASLLNTLPTTCMILESEPADQIISLAR